MAKLRGSKDILMSSLYDTVDIFSDSYDVNELRAVVRATLRACLDNIDPKNLPSPDKERFKELKNKLENAKANKRPINEHP